MMKYLHFASLAVVLIAATTKLSVYAQGSALNKAYIITNTNDTIYGTSHQQPISNSKVVFKAANAADYKEYSTGEVKALKTEDALYKRVVIPQNEMGPQPLFLLTLVNAATSLYEYKEVFYIEKPDGQITKLEKASHQSPVEQKIDLANESQGHFVRKDFRYKGVLSYLMSDCSDLSTKIARVAFTSEDLTKLVTAYNNCINPELSVEVKENPSHTTFDYGVRAGATINTMWQETPSAYNKVPFNFEPSLGYTAGAYFTMIYKNRFALQPEVLLTKKEGRGDANSISKVAYDATYIQFPLSIYLLFDEKKITPFLSIGGVYSFVNSKEAKYKRNEYAQWTNTPYDNIEIGYRVGAGLWLKKGIKRKLGIEYVFEKTEVNIYRPFYLIRHFTNHITLKYSFK